MSGEDGQVREDRPTHAPLRDQSAEASDENLGENSRSRHNPPDRRSTYKPGQTVDGVRVAGEYNSYFTDPRTKRLAFALMTLSLIGLFIVCAETVYEIDLRGKGDNSTYTSTADAVEAHFLDGDSWQNIFYFLFSISIPCCGFLGAQFKQLGLIQLFYYVSFFVATLGLISLFIVLINPDQAAEFPDCDVGEPCYDTFQWLNALLYVVYIIAACTANVFLRAALAVVEREDNIEYAVQPREVRDAQILRIVEHIAEEDQLVPLAETVNDTPPPPPSTVISRLSLAAGTATDRLSQASTRLSQIASKSQPNLRGSRSQRRSTHNGADRSL